ncbi:MAG: hypothetical protein QXP01_09560 [Candidatus Hadarchaeum sp.]
MARLVWFVKLIEKAFPQRFAFAKLTRWPVIGNLMQHWLAEGDDLIYLTVALAAACAPKTSALWMPFISWTDKLLSLRLVAAVGGVSTHAPKGQLKSL